ncbi:MAG: 8-oxo-dGTP diphosphatase [Calditrichia bacterium]
MNMKLATLCYLRQNNKTLMIHRVKKKNDIHQDKWNGLGGKFHPGETPEECVIREIEEESGLRIRNPKLKGFLTFPEFSASEDWYVFVFVATQFEGKMIDSTEGNLQWIDNDQLLNLNLWGGDRFFIEWLDKDVFFSGKFYYKDGDLLDHNMVIHSNQVEFTTEKQGDN